MYKLKVYELFKALDPVEFKDFGKFLNSPIYNSNSNLNRFYDLIKKYYPEFPENKLSSKKIFGRLYIEKKYNEKILRNLSVGIIDLYEKYLVFLEQTSEQFIRQKFLLNQLLKRKLPRLFESNFENTYKLLEQMGYKDEDYYLNRFLLETLRKDFLDENIPITKLSKDYEKYSGELDNLIFFFIILMFKEYMHIHNREGHVNYRVEYKFYDEIMNYIKRKGETFKNERLINLLTSFIKIYDDNFNKNLLKQLKGLLKLNKPYIKKDVYNFLYIDLYNYCKDQEELGRKKYGIASFKIMDDMLKNNVLAKADGYLTGNTYRNIALNAMREHEIEWAKHFIKEYKEKVRPEEKENAYQYCLGSLYYILGNNIVKRKEFYNLSLKHLLKVKPEDFGYMTGTKNKQIAMYYFFGDFENVLTVIDSYNHYLKNNVIPKDYYLRTVNFLKSISKLVKIRLGSKIYTIDKLKKDILRYKTMDFRKWMLSRIDELKEKK
jgi:hypothetical protein